MSVHRLRWRFGGGQRRRRRRRRRGGGRGGLAAVQGDIAPVLAKAETAAESILRDEAFRIVDPFGLPRLLGSVKRQ